MSNVHQSKSSTVTTAERQQIEAKCVNHLNWSDGGQWIGKGPAPNCFVRNELKNRISHTYRFSTDAAANKWNLEWEKAIRYTGHVGTAALTTVVTLTTSGIAGITVGTLAAVIKDELQATVSYPKVARGGSCEVVFEHHFIWSPHPWGQKELIQTLSVIVRDHTGKVADTKKSSRRYRLQDLPDGLGRALASVISRSTASDYR